MITTIHALKHIVEAFKYYKRKRFRRQRTVHDNIKVAREVEDKLTVELTEELKKKENVRFERAKVFQGLIDFYKEAGELKPSMQYVYDRIEKDCGHFPMDSLQEKVTAYLRKLDKEITYKGTTLANASKNIFVRLLRRICSYCYIHGRIDTHSLRMIKTYKTTPRLVDLSSELQERLLKACKKSKSTRTLYELLWFCLRNPIRKSDVLNLTTDNLDIEHHQIKYCSHKSDTISCTVIYPEQEKYFRSRLKDKDCPYLFYREGRFGQRQKIISIKKAWMKIKTIAAKGLDPVSKEKILNYRFHDTRHTSCMYLVNKQIPTNDIQSIGNWRQRSMIELYSKSDAVRAATTTREHILRLEQAAKKSKATRSNASRRRKGRRDGETN